MPPSDFGTAGSSDAAIERDQYRRQLETIAHNATLALFIMDERQQCTFMNPAAERLTGYTLDETRGRALHDVVHHTRPDGTPYPLAECPIDRAFPQNLREQGEEIFVHRDGHFYPVAFTASPIRDGARTLGTIIEVRDISEEKARERERDALLATERDARQRAEESERRFRTTADAAPVLIWTAGTDARCDWFNVPWLAFTGRRMEQEIGDGWTEVVHPDDLEHCLGTYLAAFDARTPFTMEYRMRRHDGEYRWLLDSAVPRFAGSGEFLGYIGTCMDVTEQRLARDAADAARAEAEAASRAKSQFLSTMSHELRTPLNAIAGYAELLALGLRGPLTAAQADDLARLRRANQHLMGLVTHILDFSRIEAGQVEYHIEVVSLDRMVADVESLLGPQIRAKQLAYHHDGCSTDTPDEPHHVRADPEKLRQILLNLVSNAIKFTDAGGTLTLDCEDDRTAGVLHIRVSDTGRGIAAQQLEHIFEPFYQVDRELLRESQQGVGLGLAISRDLARGMGGELSARSEPGQGATFTLTLPRA